MQVFVKTLSGKTIVLEGEKLTPENVKNAYKKMALKWHPDKNGGSAESMEMFVKMCLITMEKLGLMKVV